MTERLDFRLLGPLEVARGGELIDLGGYKQRSLLALLLIHANRAVSTDRITDALWGDEAAGKENALWVYVSRLRSVLEPERTGRGENSVLVTKDPGYVLEVDPAQVDFLRFELMLEQARNQIETDPERTVELLDEALALWRGNPLDDLAYEEFTRNEAGRLSELRLEASELRVDASLALGQTGELVSRLQAHTRENPYRERPVGQLMIALYRAGRQAEALRAYENHRRTLSEELGIDPSPELRRLEEQILLHDDRLVPRQQTPIHSLTDRALPNPYRGLHAFRESDQTSFFGRESLVAELLRRLDGGDRLIAVVGPSGSGKSSVVHAGLIPRLRKGALGEDRECVIAQMVPGAHPFDELEAALLRSRLDGPDSLSDQLAAGRNAILRAGLRVLPDGNASLLLVIDQFEELFTLVADRELQRRFLEALLAAIEEPHGRITVVLTLRADFYDRPLLHPAFGARLGTALVNVTSLSAAELEEAAVQPAAIAGVRLEPTLLARLLADVLDETGALPMFQYTMTELFERRDGDALLESSYEEMGGIRGAITHRAEDLYRQLEPDEQAAARQLFLRLVKISDEQTWSRRRVHAAEIISLDVDIVALQTAIDRFGDHRLLLFDRDLVTGAPTVEVGHEALLTEWPRLEGWIREASHDLLRHAAFANYVEDWERSEHDPEYLFAGARLDDYETWAHSSTIDLNARELAFLTAARGRRDVQLRLDGERAAREERLTGQSRRRLWALFATLAVFLVVVGAIAIAASDSKTRVALILAEPSIGGDLAIRGLEEAERRFDVEFDVVVPPWASVADVLRNLAGSGVDLILIDGALDNFAAEGVALEYPDTNFVVFHRFVRPAPPNYLGYLFGDDQSAYLAGVAAAMESTTEILGVVGAYPVNIVDDRITGFEQGAWSVDPDLEILVEYLGVGPESPVPGEGHELFSRPDLGRVAALDLFEAGADIVLHAAGNSGLGVFEAAHEVTERTGVQVWGIGADSDQYFDVPADEAEHILMSTTRGFDVAVLEAVGMVVADEFRSGTDLLTLSTGGVDYAATGDKLAAATLGAIETTKLAIISGDIVVEKRGPPPQAVPQHGPDQSGYGLVAGGRVLTAVTTRFPSPPHRVFADDGTRTGFEVELLNEIAARLDLEVQYLESPFPDLIPDVAAGVYDVAMNTLNITPERQEVVAFTSPYLGNSSVMLTTSDSGIDSIGEVSTVVVLEGSSHQQLMRREYPEIELIARNGVEVQDMVEDGRVDAWVTDFDADRIAAGRLLVIGTVAELLNAFPVNPSLAELLADMDSALAEIIDDGTYEGIYSRFFDTPEYRVDLP